MLENTVYWFLVTDICRIVPGVLAQYEQNIMVVNNVVVPPCPKTNTRFTFPML